MPVTNNHKKPDYIEHQSYRRRIKQNPHIHNSSHPYPYSEGRIAYNSQTFGVYVLYWNEIPVYVGQARNLRIRLRDHQRKIQGRRRIEMDDVACKYLTIARLWEVARAEEVLINRFEPEWNGIPGFSMHAPGRGRPGMPNYVNQWDQRFPPVS